MTRPSLRIETAREADSETTFLIPIDVMGPAWLRITCYLTDDKEFHDENVKNVDLFRDRACTRLLAYDLEWQNLADTDGLFAEIRKQQNARDAKRAVEIDRSLAQAVSMAPVWDAVFSRLSR